MATYKCSEDLLGKTLEFGDFVILKDISYKVQETFLNNLYGVNDQIFEDLKIPKFDIANQAYGYVSIGGSWPECKRCDYPALTRLVIELYKIIERETSITSKKEQWYKITAPGKTGISPEKVKALINKYGGLINPIFDYNSDAGVYIWTKNTKVECLSKQEIREDAIEISPTTEITTTKKEEKHETQFQRKKAHIERGTRPEGSTVCGRRSKASVAVGHLSYRKVTGI